MHSKKLKANKIIQNIKALDPKKKRSLGFLLAGIFLLSSLLIYRFIQIRRLSFNTGQTVVIDPQKPTPTHIRIEKFNLSENIVPAGITDGIWDISKENANFLASSSSPGEKGNMVIYGHNSTDIFGPIRWVEIGDEIVVTNASGEEFAYSIQKTFETSSDDISWVLPKEEETLTLYTCTGFLNKKRHIIVAIPK